MPSILALIPARRNSKGIPLKNIREMAGRPLIAWTIKAALESRHPMRIVCSTDDDEIAQIARSCGAEAPFRRPDELSTDEAPTIGVAMHALATLEGEFTHLLLLQPTSPLRTGADIDGALDLSSETGASAVIGVSDAPSHPYLTYRIGENGSMEAYCQPSGVSLRRQDLPRAYVVNGAVYVNRIESLTETGTFLPRDAVGFPMSRDRSVDIDDPESWRLAEQHLIERHG